MNRLDKAGAALLALMLAVPVLGGCGKKPELLDPREGAPAEARNWPRIYPNPGRESRPVVPAAKPPAVPEPLEPEPAYPRLPHQGDMTSPSVLSLPDPAAAGAWATPQKNK